MQKQVTASNFDAQSWRGGSRSVSNWTTFNRGAVLPMAAHRIDSLGLRYFLLLPAALLENVDVKYPAARNQHIEESRTPTSEYPGAEGALMVITSGARPGLREYTGGIREANSAETIRHRRGRKNRRKWRVPRCGTFQLHTEDGR